MQRACHRVRPVVAEEHRIPRRAVTSNRASVKTVAPPRCGVFRYMTSDATRWPPRAARRPNPARRGRTSRSAVRSARRGVPQHLQALAILGRPVEQGRDASLDPLAQQVRAARERHALAGATLENGFAAGPAPTTRERCSWPRASSINRAHSSADNRLPNTITRGSSNCASTCTARPSATISPASSMPGGAGTRTGAGRSCSRACASRNSRMTRSTASTAVRLGPARAQQRCQQRLRRARPRAPAARSRCVSSAANLGHRRGSSLPMASRPSAALSAGPAGPIPRPRVLRRRIATQAFEDPGARRPLLQAARGGGPVG